MVNDSDWFYFSFDDDDELNNLVNGPIEYSDDFWRGYELQSDIQIKRK